MTNTLRDELAEIIRNEWVKPRDGMNSYQYQCAQAIIDHLTPTLTEVEEALLLLQPFCKRFPDNGYVNSLVEKAIESLSALLGKGE